MTEMPDPIEPVASSTVADSLTTDPHNSHFAGGGEGFKPPEIPPALNIAGSALTKLVAETRDTRNARLAEDAKSWNARRVARQQEQE